MTEQQIWFVLVAENHNSCCWTKAIQQIWRMIQILHRSRVLVQMNIRSDHSCIHKAANMSACESVRMDDTSLSSFYGETLLLIYALLGLMDHDQAASTVSKLAQDKVTSGVTARTCTDAPHFKLPATLKLCCRICYLDATQLLNYLWIQFTVDRITLFAAFLRIKLQNMLSHLL